MPPISFVIASCDVLKLQTFTAIYRIPYHPHAAMSFQRLVNISHSNATAYPLLRSDAPITPRRFTDETDTASNTSSLPEDADTDDGTEQLLDYRARVLRRRHAHARVQNTVQYAHDRINDGLRPVHDLVNEARVDGDHFYNDVALPFFDEAVLQIQAVVITLWRLLIRLFWYILNLVKWTVVCTLSFINASFWSILDLIGASFWYTLDLVRAPRGFTLNLLRQFLFAIPQLLRDTPWHLLKRIAVAIGLVLVSLSMLHGSRSTVNFICSDANAPQQSNALSDFCSHPNLIAVLDTERRALDKLVRASNTIIYGIGDMSKITTPNLAPGRHLLTDATALERFVEVHGGSLAPFSKPEDVVAVASAVRSNVITFNYAVEIFKHDHIIRAAELETKFQRILSNAKEYTEQSYPERFFLETAAYFIPSAFSYTGIARQTSDYLGVASHFLNDSQTTNILQQGVKASQSIINATQAILIVEKAISQYEPLWKTNCENSEIRKNSGKKLFDGNRCDSDPADLTAHLADSLEKSREAAKSVHKLHKLHKAVINAMTDLREDLKRLRERADGSLGDNLDAASARAVLHDFVVQVGQMDIMIGSGTFVVEMGLGGNGVKGGSRYEIREDGSLRDQMARYSQPQ